MGLLVLVTDQIIKLLLARLRPEWLLGNRGIAFGLPINYPSQLLIFLLILVVAGALLYQAWREGPPLVTYGVTFFLAGSLSNLIDRIRTGYVVDYLPVGFGWRLNLGDLAIALGLTLLIWFLIFPRGRPWLSSRLS